MKTTLEIPDALFRRAKATAAIRGQSFKSFVTEAIQGKLQSADIAQNDAPWRALFGGLKHLHHERPAIEAAIEAAFEVVEPEPNT